MYKRVLTPLNDSFFLLGMRGTGKSSWVESQFSQGKLFDLLDESEYLRYLERPELFASQLRILPAGSWVVVDEIQRLPSLLNEIHRAIEKQKLKFALLGSSARKLRRAGVNLLGGRALLRTMYPLLPQEMGKDFSLEKVLQFGSLPLTVASQDPAERLEAYIKLYLKEEIQAEAIVRNLPGFARFFPIAALFNAQTINITAVGRDAGVARTTTEGYFKILEDTLLGFFLPAYEAKLRVKERSHPKWYWLDNGVARAAKRTLGVPVSEERGALFEGLIAMLFRAFNDLKILEFDTISYWSPNGSKIEVDFILERGKEKIAIEVKSCREPDNEHLKGLRAIADLPGLKKRILLYPGETDRRTVDSIDIIGFHSFIRAVSEGRLW